MSADPKDNMEALFASALWSQAPHSFDSLFKANARAAEVWLASWSRFASESANFMTKRWAQDNALVEKLMACKNPTDVLQVQGEFMRNAFADYMKEAEVVASMEHDAGAAGLKAYDEAAKSVLEQSEKATTPANKPAAAKRG